MAQLIINKFYWGMSDTDAYASDAVCAYQENVDWMSQPELLKLNRKTTPRIWTQNGLAVAHVEGYYYADNWIVYDITSTPVLTLPAGAFYNAIKFGDAFIGFYVEAWNLKLAHTPLTALGAPIWWSTTLNYWINPDLTPFQPALNWHFYCVAINDSEDTLYFIGKNIIYRALVSQLPLIEPGIVFEDDVVWLTRQGQQITVYLQNGRKYFWDGYSEQHDGYIDLW